MNLVGDFGGGALYLALGVVAALLEAHRSGKGQTVDAAMVDGVASLLTSTYALHGAGITNDRRGENILDSGAHFYDVYETSDGKYVALAAIEPKFYAQLLKRTGIDPETLPHLAPTDAWPELKERLAAVIKTKTRDQWCALLEGTDACFAPVLDLNEAPRHPHNQARGTFAISEDVVQPNPAPRFSRTPTHITGPPAQEGEQTEEVLTEWGFGVDEIALLREQGVIGGREV